MKLLNINSYYEDDLYSYLTNELNKLGVSSDSYYYCRKGTSSKKGTDNQVYYSECYTAFDRFNLKRKIWKAETALSSTCLSIDRYDCIHAHSLFSNGTIALDIWKRYGIPYVVSVRNTDINSFFKLRPLCRTWGIEVLTHASSVVFISECYKELVNRYLPVDIQEVVRKKATVIPNGIDEFFLDNTPESPKAIDRLKPIRLLQVGKINKNKNQITSMRVCEKLNREGVAATLDIIGKSQNKRIESKLRSSPYVNVLPSMNHQELLEYYNSTDIFIMPSYRETFGISYVEAMSQGLPIIYTSGQGFDGQYAEGEVGYAVTPNCDSEIIEAISRIINNYSEISARAIIRAGHFRWEESAKKYKKLYVKACNKR